MDIEQFNGVFKKIPKLDRQFLSNIFSMGTSWVASINNKYKNSSEKRNVNVFDFNEVNVSKSGMWRARYLPSLIALLLMYFV